MKKSKQIIGQIIRTESFDVGLKTLDGDVFVFHPKEQQHIETSDGCLARGIQDKSNTIKLWSGHVLLCGDIREQDFINAMETD